jgi:hypothetical protein
VESRQFFLDRLREVSQAAEARNDPAGVFDAQLASLLLELMLLSTRLELPAGFDESVQRKLSRLHAIHASPESLGRAVRSSHERVQNVVRLVRMGYDDLAGQAPQD